MMSGKDFLKSHFWADSERCILTGKMLCPLAGCSRSLGQRLGKHGYRQLIGIMTEVNADYYQLCWCVWWQKWSVSCTRTLMERPSQAPGCVSCLLMLHISMKLCWTFCSFWDTLISSSSRVAVMKLSVCSWFIIHIVFFTCHVTYLFDSDYHWACAAVGTSLVQVAYIIFMWNLRISLPFVYWFRGILYSRTVGWRSTATFWYDLSLRSYFPPFSDPGSGPRTKDGSGGLGCFSVCFCNKSSYNGVPIDPPSRSPQLTTLSSIYCFLRRLSSGTLQVAGDVVKHI